MSKKTKGIILIILGISVALIALFLLNSNKQKISNPIVNPPTPSISINNDKSNKEKISKIVLEVNEKKYESSISTETNVYDLMSQMQKEGKITFKEKKYIGMGEFIEEINNIKNNDKENWIYYVNGKKANIGVSNYKINNGDIVSWKYE